MPNPTADRRTVRTKSWLRQALVQLMDEKGLDNITVSDLTSRAEINRGTFYLHYKDVADMVEQLQSEMLNGLEQFASRVNFLEILRHAGQNEPYPNLHNVFEYWQRNADFCKPMLGPKGDPAFVLRIKEMMKSKIYRYVFEAVALIPAEKRPAVPLDFILEYMTSANIGIIQHWFASGMQQTPREMAMIMTLLVSQGPIAASGLKAES